MGDRAGGAGRARVLVVPDWGGGAVDFARAGSLRRLAAWLERMLGRGRIEFRWARWPRAGGGPEPGGPEPSGCIDEWARWLDGAMFERRRQYIEGRLEAVDPRGVLAAGLGALVAIEALRRRPRSGSAAGIRLITWDAPVMEPGVLGSRLFRGRVGRLPIRHWDAIEPEGRRTWPAGGWIPESRVTRHIVPEGFARGGMGLLDIVLSPPWGFGFEGETAEQARRGRSGNVRIQPRVVRSSRQRRTAPGRRALLVGIDRYPDPAHRLEGCANDVFLVSARLQERGYAAEEIRVLLNERATAAAIRQRWDWLVEGVRGGHQRVFYFSGHGAQMPGYGWGERIDHADECLVPVDFDWTADRAILDDHLFAWYSQLPYDVGFVAMLDCCHSGGMDRGGIGRVRGLHPPDDIRHRGLRWDAASGEWVARDWPAWGCGLGAAKQAEFFGAGGALRRLGRAAVLRRTMDAGFQAACRKLGHRGPYMPVILQACGEAETAAEIRVGTVAHGAFTWAVNAELKQGRSMTWLGLIAAVTRRLRRAGIGQSPQAAGPGAVLAAGVLPV